MVGWFFSRKQKIYIHDFYYKTIKNKKNSLMESTIPLFGIFPSLITILFMHFQIYQTLIQKFASTMSFFLELIARISIMENRPWTKLNFNWSNSNQWNISFQILAVTSYLTKRCLSCLTCKWQVGHITKGTSNLRQIKTSRKTIQ